jgi:hypothetical protein
MPCCGQKRNVLKTNSSPSSSYNVVKHQVSPALPSFGQTPTAHPPTAANLSSHAIALEYTERSAIVVEGSATHRLYRFSAVDPVQMVDSRDAGALLSTRFFLRR